MIIFESKWQNENGELIERNMHDHIREEIIKEKEAVEALLALENSVSELKKRGFEIIYSLKINQIKN